MIPPPPRPTRSYTLFPSTTLFRSFLNGSGSRAAACIGGTGRAGAAVFGEIAEQRIHRGIVGGVDEGPALTLLPNQSRPRQLSEMEGKRRVGDAQSLGDRDCRHALVAGLDTETDRREAVLLRARSPIPDEHRIGTGRLTMR